MPFRAHPRCFASALLLLVVPAGCGSDGMDGTTTSTAGVPAWTARHAGQDDGGAFATGLAVSEAGRVAVVGSDVANPGDPFPNLDVWVGMLDPDGAFAWTSSYQGEGAGDDESLAVAFHPGGDVVVLGQESRTKALHGFAWIGRYAP